jgi:triphosphatase
MVTEIELKYSLFESPDLASAQQIKSIICQVLSEHKLLFVHQEKQLSNHYFDTDNLSLRKQKIALRTRGTVGAGKAERFEQTIKTSGTVIAGLHQRPEYNVDLIDDKPILSLFPETIWKEGTDIAQLQQQVIELFSTNFTRHTWLVTFADAQIELAFDSGEIACQGYEEKPRIYEIELELVNGDTHFLLLLTKLLFSSLKLRPGQLTKAARGYALFRDSVANASADKNKERAENRVVEQVSLPMITLPKDMPLVEAFKQGINFSLTQLQLTVDEYVTTPSLELLSKISELLALMRQGFWLFNELLSDEEIKLRSELSYFIRTIHWVNNAIYIQALNNKKSCYQKETSFSQTLITKLQLVQRRYPSEPQVIALLHSERFNNLQLSLLSLLLRNEGSNVFDREVVQPLTVFASYHLTNSASALNNELKNIQTPTDTSTTELYLTAHSLLIRGLLTASWFSSLFKEADNALVKKFNIPWIDIKQGISELQSLTLLQEQLVHLESPDKKLASWLAGKIDNLIMALDQSRAKALSMKPYWL